MTPAVILPSKLRDPFRLALYLVAVIVLMYVTASMAVVAGCEYLILFKDQPVGICAEPTRNIREMLTEIIAAILALVVASRPGPPPPD